MDSIFEEQFDVIRTWTFKTPSFSEFLAKTFEEVLQRRN